VDYESINAALNKLAANPLVSNEMVIRPGGILSHKNLFGVLGHKFIANPVLTQEHVASVETKYAIALPASYRDFLLHVGNGGAGPNYGIFKLETVNLALGAEHLWADVPYFVGSLSCPFPHIESWNDCEDRPTDCSDPAYEELTQRFEQNYFDPKIVNGAIPISDAGCNLRYWLVVTGPEKGNIWFDKRADFGGLIPVSDALGHHMSFESWYMKWLDGCTTILFH
jgi:hypothetical protein